VPREVERDHLEAIGKRLDLRAPEGTVREAAVDEEQGGAAAARRQ